MRQGWKERLRQWICDHTRHSYRPLLDEHGKTYPNLNECRRCKHLDSPNPTQYANGVYKHREDWP